MSLYAINERETIAALHVQLAARTYHGATVEAMFAAIEQHPAAILQSAVEEALDEACPYCCAPVGQDCRWDCSSRFEE